MTLGLGGSVRASASSPPPTPSPLQPGGPDLLRLARQPRRVGAFEHIVQRKETPQEYLHEGISQGLESRQLAVEEEIRGRAVGGLSLCRPFASHAPLRSAVATDDGVGGHTPRASASVSGARSWGVEGGGAPRGRASWSCGSLNFFDQRGHPFLVIPNGFIALRSGCRENDEALFQ